MNDAPRRLYLRVTLKLLALFGIGLAVYALLASIGGEPENTTGPQPMTIPLERTPAEGLRRIAWPGGKLILLHRSPETLKALERLDGTLRDPTSQNADQPAGLPSPQRSHHPRWFVAFDRGTDMGCPLQWVAPGSDEAPLQPWPGGLRDSCRGSWYDAAGRVLRGQEAKRNLAIPPHRLLATDLLEVGQNGDNPHPAD